MSDLRETGRILSNEILGNIELADISLSAVMLKCARLARLIGDHEGRQVFVYEAGGYPSGPGGVENRAFELARRSGRVYQEAEKDGQLIERMNTASIEALEKSVEANRLSISAAADPDVSVTSANPSQNVFSPIGNSHERRTLRTAIWNAEKILAQSKAFAYNYVLNAHYELEFAKTASDIFERTAEQVDIALLRIAPSAAQKTASIRENILSTNPEDWANAVHSCRRLLQEIADALYPPTEPQERGGRHVKLGPDNYINRLIAYIEDRKGSKRFEELVGSTLAYVGERLDAVFKAAQKGSHASISSREEAERYVIYTYLTVGDVLALGEAEEASGLVGQLSTNSPSSPATPPPAPRPLA